MPAAPTCNLPHCDHPSAEEHAALGIRLCTRCRDLVEHFGYPRTLGDLANLVELAVLSFGPSKVRAALSKLDETG